MCVQYASPIAWIAIDTKSAFAMRMSSIIKIESAPPAPRGNNDLHRRIRCAASAQSVE